MVLTSKTARELGTVVRLDGHAARPCRHAHAFRQMRWRRSVTKINVDNFISCLGEVVEVAGQAGIVVTGCGDMGEVEVVDDGAGPGEVTGLRRSRRQGKGRGTAQDSGRLGGDSKAKTGLKGLWRTDAEPESGVQC